MSKPFKIFLTIIGVLSVIGVAIPSLILLWANINTSYPNIEDLPFDTGFVMKDDGWVPSIKLMRNYGSKMFVYISYPLYVTEPAYKSDIIQHVFVYDTNSKSLVKKEIQGRIGSIYDDFVSDRMATFIDGKVVYLRESNDENKVDIILFNPGDSIEKILYTFKRTQNGPTKEYGHHPINIVSDEQNILIFESKAEAYAQGQIGVRRWVLINIRTGEIKEMTPVDKVYTERMHLVNNKLIWEKGDGIAVMDLQTGIQTTKDIAKNKSLNFGITSLIDERLYWAESEMFSPTRYYSIYINELI